MESSELRRAAASLRETGTVSLHRSFISQPSESLTQHLGRTDVRRHNNPVVHPFAFASGLYDSGTAKIGQMPGYFGLSLLQDLHEIADADLLLSHQIEQAKSSVVAECLEEAFHFEL